MLLLFGIMPKNDYTCLTWRRQYDFNGENRHDAPQVGQKLRVMIQPRARFEARIFILLWEEGVLIKFL
jgi:hypothetical protein